LVIKQLKEKLILYSVLHYTKAELNMVKIRTIVYRSFSASNG